MTSFSPGPGHERLYRDALGQFATGVTVVTTQSARGPCGITVNSFSGLSLAPPLIMWAIDRASDRIGAFLDARYSAVHVLGEDQAQTALAFAQSDQAFGGSAWTENPEAVPVLDHCLARFECEAHASHDGGDHIILVLRVLRVTTSPGRPLIFQAGTFDGLASRD